MSATLPERRPRVSVVMAVLNPHPVYFRQAVESILRQTLTDLEFIIVEEPSPRAAAAVLAEFADGRVRHLFHPQRTSLVDQRNRALAAAGADYVAILDADDIADPHRLKKQVAFLDVHSDVDVLGSQLAIMDPAGNHLGYRVYPHDHDAIVRCLPRANTIAQPAVMCRRQAVLAEGGYGHVRYPAEDYELWSRLAQRGLRFANHPEALVRYRVHPEGMKSSRLRSVLRGTLEVKRRYWTEQMDLGARTRFWAEQLLLCLPPRLVLNAFMRTHYRAELPVPDKTRLPVVPV